MKLKIKTKTSNSPKQNTHIQRHDIKLPHFVSLTVTVSVEKSLHLGTKVVNNSFAGIL